MAAPELYDEETGLSEDELDGVPTPVPPDQKKPTKVRVVVPYDATGHIVRINGKKYLGPMDLEPEVIEQIWSMLTAKEQIERERLMNRGNAVGSDNLVKADAASRIVARRGPRVI